MPSSPLLPSPSLSTASLGRSASVQAGVLTALDPSQGGSRVLTEKGQLSLHLLTPPQGGPSGR